MHAAVEHIICMISVIFMTFTLHGQNAGRVLSDWDTELNRYELECAECMALKDRVSSGAEVTRKEAEALIENFLARNRAIKENLSSMSPDQKRRFDAINLWFRTGIKPLAMTPAVHVDQVRPEPYGYAELSESECHINISTRKTVPFSVRPPRTFPDDRKKWTALATGSVNVPSYGVMAGFQKGRWGGYVKPRTNFHHVEAGYSCFSDGSLGNGGTFWANGRSVRNITSITAGPMIGVTGRMDIYAGAGYGYDTLLWEDIDGNWAEVVNHSYKGVVAEAGLLFSVSQLTFGIGCSTLSFHKYYLELCLGLSLKGR